LGYRNNRKSSSKSFLYNKAFSGTVTNATNVAIISDTSATTFYPYFGGVGSGSPGTNQGLKSSSSLSYVPSTGTLTATTFSGSLSGNATSSTNVAITNTTAATTYYPTFVTANTGNLPLYVTSTALSFVASTGVLTSTSFNATSLRSLKENIVLFDEKALTIMKKVKVVKYNFKTDTSKQTKIGFIADDTHEYLATKEHNSMDIANTIGLLVK
jgi:hypothetical protein